MSLQPGAALGGYTIVAKLGEGGMGEVYRATDSRLGRDVAIKVLPESVANDPDRRARFEREAKTLASLNHFNIAQVYGFEGAAIVMELLEGQTLRERLANGALPLRRALDFGAQIARGLAAAHERGIIHRDLKPENIFIVNEGQIKILDFGLARQSAELLEATATGGGTAPGVVLGTAGYMSPEQVRGHLVDTRSDVFALGAVLFEMLVGKRAFRRDSAAETMTAVLNEHPPDVSAERAEISPAVDRIVQHCLEKHPAERFQSTRDVAFALESLSGSASSAYAAAARLPSKNRERLAWAAVAVTLGAAAIGPWLVRKPAASTPAVISRTQVLLPPDITLNDAIFPISRLAISRDGTQLAFAGRHRTSGQSQLYLLPLETGEARPLSGTRDGGSPIWSPDGSELIFSDATKIQRVPIGGGSAQPIADPTLGSQRGSWSGNGVVLIGGSQLRRISPQGGPPTNVRAAPGERYAFPQLLPDGRHFVFMAVRLAGGAVSVRVGSLDSDDDRELLNGTDLNGVAYANGALLFARGTTLYAQAFDLSRFDLSGEPVILAAPLQAAQTRGAAFAVSDDVLVYQASERLDATQLTWLDRTGRILSTMGEPSNFSNLELSPDGKRLLASASDEKLQTRDIFIVDVIRGVRQRFTLDPSDERSAVWSPDQQQVIFSSKGLNLYRRASDLSGEEQPVLVDGDSKDPYDWSPDGHTLLYRRTGPAGNDLWLHPLRGGEDRPIAVTRFSEVAGNFSPDGKWIVYTSDESGRSEVYATRVDGGGRIQISSLGGQFPRWRGDGREILYLAPDRRLMSAMVIADATTLDVKPSVALFQLDIEAAPGPIYDVTADGSRLIVGARVQSRIQPAIMVLQNWSRLLRPQSSRP
ncbi:MAG: serine/threonine-protein kinase [Cyanobacteria bacterium]|nr:serine/threonine-protein kinase [Cyanobacteriota bacterium]